MTDASLTVAAAGWHGKLPTLGDFATRRLAPDFVQLWDAWLSHGLAALQQQADWLDAYLASPSWRFLLLPGALPGPFGDTAWAGVLMPSVDRVGRYYPLTLAHPLSALPHGGAEIDSLWVWLLRLDELAADALQDDWSLDRFESELAKLGVPASPVADQPAAPVQGAPHSLAELSLAGSRHPGDWFAAQAQAGWLTQVHGLAYWYSQPDLESPKLLRSPGLAPDELLQRLLGTPRPVA